VLPIWEGTSNILSLDVLRALETVDAHEALIPYVTERLAGVDHPALADAVASVREAFRDLQTGLGTLATEDDEYAQYHAKRLADLVYDVVAATVLLVEADAALAAGEARTALVARWFVRDRFDSEDAYGLTSGTTPGHDHFDAIARYESVDPEVLDADREPAPADD
jgi:acyl-CoA dehydrogenase